MRRAILCCLLPVVAAACWPAVVDAGKPPPFTIGAIHAYFEEHLFATNYYVTWTQPAWTSARNEIKPHVTWTLRLQIVGDDAGKPYFGLPGSGGAVDLGCNNAGVGVAQPFVQERLEVSYRVTDRLTASRGEPFTWHHPDAVDSRPPGRYHCDHNDMGPHGHQGLITVTVTGEKPQAA